MQVIACMSPLHKDPLLVLAFGAARGNLSGVVGVVSECADQDCDQCEDGEGSPYEIYNRQLCIAPSLQLLWDIGGGGGLRGTPEKFLTKSVSKEHFLRRVRDEKCRRQATGLKNQCCFTGVGNVFKENAVLGDVAFPFCDRRLRFCSNLFIRSFGAGEK